MAQRWYRLYRKPLLRAMEVRNITAAIKASCRRSWVKRQEANSLSAYLSHHHYPRPLIPP